MGNQSTKQGKDKSKKNVHWKSAEPPSAPGKPILVPGLPSDEPDVVTIKWSPPQSDGGSQMIGFIVEHRRTGSPHWVRACPQLVAATELSLSGLEPGWRYQFRIIAENPVGKSEPSEISDALTVTLQRNAISAPRFTIELLDTIGVENEKVEFKAIVTGSPQPQISWFKDGFEIFSSRRTKIMCDNDTSVLIIHQAALTDEGEIKCTATNRAGYAMSRAKLVIDAPPKIRLPRQYEDGLIIEAEEIIRLKVGIAGRPTPSVIWTHNGEIITSGGRYEILNTDKNSFLKIMNSNRSDRGEYNLRSINKLGEDNASFLVTITARPTPPGKVIIKMSLAKTVTLSWTPPNDDGGCKIGNYIVEYFRIGWGVWLKAATCRQLSTTLNELIEGSEYKFRVKAENPYGLSDPSEESEVLFLPDVKRGILKPVAVSETIEEIPSKKQPIALPRRKHAPSPSPVKERQLLANDSKSLTSALKPAINIQFTSEVYDNDALERDMSYGASDSFYKFSEMPSEHVEKSLLEDKLKQSKGNKISVKFQDEMPSSKNITHNDLTDLNNNIKKINENLEISNSDSKTQSIQNSSEFMLVLYQVKDSKTNTNNDTFDLELEDLIAPPPLSQSAPELGIQLPVAPLMRSAVSSTELLYEKAMARLYQAVEYEESENARKRSESVDKEALRRRSFTADDETLRLTNTMNPQESARTRLRINSLTDGERRSTLKRRLSGDAGLTRRLSFRDNESDIEDSYECSKKPENIKKSPSPINVAPVEKDIDGNFSDDYTDSTASSGDLSVLSEKIAPAVVRQSRQSRDDAEMETYHPRMLSPYRRVNPEDAVEVLSKPLSPLPDPNFVPKPILKRSIIEFDDKSKKKAPEKPERKSLSQFFGHGSKSPSVSPTPSPKESRKNDKVINTEPLQNSLLIELHIVPTEIPEIRFEQPQISNEIIEPPVISPSEIAKKKKLEKRQNSLEENKVAADFYGDIIREVGAHLKKPKIPIYMNPEALKQLEIEDEEPVIQETINIIKQLEPPQVKLIEPERNISPKPKPSPILTERPMSPPVIKSVSPIVTRPMSNSLQYNAGLKDNDENINVVSQFKEEIQSFTKTGTIPKRRSASLSRNTESQLPIVHPSQQPSAVQQKILRREKGSSRTRNRSESKSPAPLTRRVIIKKENTSSLNPSRLNISSKNITPTSSPSLSRAVTPSELKEEIEIKAKSNISYVTDISLLVFATWLYFFKHALLALPILLLLLYRQLGEAIQNQIPDWVKRKKS